MAYVLVYCELEDEEKSFVVSKGQLCSLVVKSSVQDEGEIVLDQQLETVDEDKTTHEVEQQDSDKIQEAVGIKEKEKSHLLNLLSSIKVTPELLNSSELFDLILKAMLPLQTQDNKECLGFDTKLSQWQVGGVGKVKLADEVNCWIDAATLSVLKHEWQHKPNLLVNKLLLHLVNEKELGTLNACGGRGKESVPSEVKSAINENDTMVSALPRHTPDHYIITVELKRLMCHKHGQKEVIRPANVHSAAHYLTQCELFRTLDVKYDENWDANDSNEEK
ncbi:hypothetical protein HCN44_008838 [Aphidius gifuensis]|uniref:Uncharacterized protein n=1 Tax=Aphidius gifuensis TaxID=684658 RepID=A0A834Y1M5_APHGI|nr:hypothetical protein HCN44_008838 [Aphidius gifuensis]